MRSFCEREYVMLDLDGTVIDSKEGIFNGLYYCMDKIGMTPPDESILQQFIGPSVIATFIRLYHFTEEQADEACRYYREYYSVKGLTECRLYTGIPELLKRLREQGKKVGLATKKPEVYARKILDNLNVSSLFDVIGGSEPGDRSEYKGYVLEKVMKGLGAEDKSLVVMVGDSEYDCIAADMAGVDCIGVLYGYGLNAEEKFQKYGAAQIVKDVATLTCLLTGEN